MDILIIFGGIVGIAIIVAIVASAATISSVAGVFSAREDESEE